MSRKRVLPEDRQGAGDANDAVALSATDWELPTEYQGGGAVGGRPRQRSFGRRLFGNGHEINDFFRLVI